MRSRSQPPTPDRERALAARRSAARPAARTVVQTKLTLGPPGDRYEREADSVAKQVMASIAAPPAAQRQPEEEELMASRVQRQPEEEELMASRVQRQPEEEEEELMASRVQRQPEEEELMASRVQRQPEEEEMLQGKLQLKAVPFADHAEPGPVDQAIESQIQGARSGGQPLDAGVRGSMEAAFGADFSGVRVHTGQAADALNSSLRARAFTTGRDIFFRQGDYDPGSRAGQELIAHELTHVVQQRGAPPSEMMAAPVQRMTKSDRRRAWNQVGYIGGSNSSRSGYALLFPQRAYPHVTADVDEADIVTPPPGLGFDDVLDASWKITVTRFHYSQSDADPYREGYSERNGTWRRDREAGRNAAAADEAATKLLGNFGANLSTDNDWRHIDDPKAW